MHLIKLYYIFHCHFFLCKHGLKQGKLHITSTTLRNGYYSFLRGGGQQVLREYLLYKDLNTKEKV